jgi:hypothetical protein
MNVEKSFRQFLRSHFKARIARNDDGAFVTSVKGKTAKAEIKNFNTVVENLTEVGKLVSESAKATVFNYTAPKAEGGQKMQITVAHVGAHDYVTAVTK